MANPAKLLRGQLRQIVKELLPDLLTTELRSEMHQKLAKEVQARLDNVTQNVKDTLNMLDERSKNMESYLVRSAPQAVQPVVDTEVSESAKTE